MSDAVAIIGAGPAGLMAAEVVSAAGLKVDVYDAMPSVGRKLLRAGIGGLNLTHSEAPDRFVARYGAQADTIAPWLADFGPEQVRDWANTLGIETFVGSSGRVFPVGMKAAPLLRAWLKRLTAQGVRFHLRHRWLGWDDDGAWRFATPDGVRKVGSGSTGRPAGRRWPGEATATVLALGGGSWARLGANAEWVPLLAARDLGIAPLRPTNCGFEVGWSEHLRSRFAGQPLKTVSARFENHEQQGEFLITRHGLEGGLIYALSAPLRDAIERDGKAVLQIDLAAGRELDRLVADLKTPQGHDSLANHLRRRAGIEGLKAALLREVASAEQLRDPVQCATLIKALPLTLTATRPIDEAISTAGGIKFDQLNGALMLNAFPGVFCAGEMLDWEAPTGGYLLTACLASGYRAGHGVLRWRRAR